MANLLEISQLVYNQLFPNPTPQTATKLDEIIETSKGEYAYQMWLISKEEKKSEGEWEVPSTLLRRTKLEVVDNEASLVNLGIFRSLEGDTWIASLGELGGDCRYMRMSTNVASMLLDDDNLGNAKPYIPIGNALIFPKGAFGKTVDLIYASNGEDVPDEINVDDAIGGLIRRSLMEIYQLKYPSDTTNNNNPDK